MKELHWYAMRSHPHREEALARELEARNIEVFFPHFKVKPVNPRSRRIRPYFPGYLFIRADLEAVGASAFQWMPYAYGVVSFGDAPSPVPDNLLHAIKTRLSNGAIVEVDPTADLQTNQPVAIEQGPFAGYEAIFDIKIPGSERVRVLLQMLNKRQVPLELDASHVRPTKSRKNSPK